MSHIGEFDLIGRISDAVKDRIPDGVCGIGDDCAVLPQMSGYDTLVTTDLLVEDRHFLLDDIPAEALGWKSAAVNISDIAAMGGTPESAFLSIALPGRIDSGWVERFIAGFMDLAGRHGVALLGGDTSASPDKLFINITVLGSCLHGTAVKRSGACPGDLVCVTGTLGDSAAGLKLVLENDASRHIPGTHEAYLLGRHYRPEPRVREGIALAALNGVHAMMDISDGIASDLRHILDASCCGAVVDVRLLPLSESLKHVCAQRGWDAAGLAAGGGEDYELLFTAAPGTIIPPGCTRIGYITSGDALKWDGTDKEYKGFTHF
ncbi:MAG: thiamine-phosphate kinase [Bacteroidales bacterium]|nr:thiamine-phosphate kinase [Bacteroidales bacterium]